MPVRFPGRTLVTHPHQIPSASVRNLSQELDASVTATGSVTVGDAFLRTLSASVSAVGSIIKQVNKIVFLGGGGTNTQGMNAVVGVVPTMIRGKVTTLSAAIGVTIPGPLSPLLPFEYGRIVMQVSHLFPSVSVASVGSVTKRAAHTMISTAVSASGTIVRSTGKIVSAVVAVVGSIANHIPQTEVLMQAAVAAVPSVVRSIAKPLSSVVASLLSLVTVKTFGGITTLKAMSASVASLGTFTNIAGKILTSTVVNAVATMVKEVDKETDALVAVVPSVIKSVQPTLSAVVAVVGTLLEPALHLLAMTAQVAATTLPPIAAKIGAITAKTMTATIAVATPLMIKSVVKPLSVVLVAPTLTLKKQVQLHILPRVAVVGTFTNRVNKKMTAVVTILAPGPIGHFGLHFAQTISATVRAVGHLRECFQLKARVHDPGSPLTLTPEDPDTTLATNPHDSGCQGD